MKLHIQVSHTFDVGRDVLVERVIFDEDFNRELHDHLGFRSRRVLWTRDDGERVVQRIEYESDRKVPWVLRGLVGRRYIGWAETITFHPDDYRMEIDMEPMALPERIRSHGVMRWLEAGPGRTRRTYDIDVEVRLPMVSGALARAMVRDVEQTYVVADAFIERWLRDRELGSSEGPAPGR